MMGRVTVWAVFHYNFKQIIVRMGQSVSSTNDRAALLSSYDELDIKCEYGTVICHKVTKQTYLLKQLNFPDHNQYKKALKLFEIKKEKTRENVLNLVQLQNQSKSLFCSEIYRLSLVYQFAQITLAEQIEARQSQCRYFEQQDLWSIIQSCLYGLVQISENMVFQPNRVYIMSDGLVKIVDPDIVSNNSWYMLDENMYYAPQRFHNFANSNKINTTEHEAMFSLGATLLNAAILESCFDCYEYGSHRFNERKLSEKLQRLQRLYSEDFKTVICGLLEVNPQTRMGMQELQEIVGKLANQDMEQHSEQQVSYAQKSHQQEPKQQQKQQPFREVGNYPSHQYYPREPQISNPPPVIKFKNIEIKQTLEPIIEYPRENVKFENSRLPSSKEVESQSHSIQYSYNAGIQSIHLQSPPSYQIDNRLESVRSKNITQFDGRSNHFDSGMKDYTSLYRTQREKDENLFTDPKLMEQIRRDIIEITARRSLIPTNSTTQYPSGLSIQQEDFDPLYLSKPQPRPQFQFQPQPQTHYEQDGKIFEGVVINGMKQGFGKLSYPEGPFYVGNFVNDKMHGKGILYYGQNKPAYDGQWYEDQFHGKGTLYNENPLEQDELFDFNDFNLVEDYWTKYEGEFVNDNKQGFGKLFLSNGERFEGSFERDCVHGEGAFFDAFGGKYEGRWDNNVLEERFSKR